MSKARQAVRTRSVGNSLVAVDGGSGWRTRPVLAGEDRQAYDKLCGQVTAIVAPRDILEEFWVQDIVDLVWELARLRRLKVALLASSAHEGIRRVLSPLKSELGVGPAGYIAADALASNWYSRHAEALGEVEDLLEQVGLTPDAITAQTLSARLEDIERIDRMIGHSEARRSAIIRELDRRREAVARGVRGAAGPIEDAAFTEVEGGNGLGSAFDQ